MVTPPTKPFDSLVGAGAFNRDCSSEIVGIRCNFGNWVLLVVEVVCELIGVRGGGGWIVGVVLGLLLSCSS